MAGWIHRVQEWISENSIDSGGRKMSEDSLDGNMYVTTASMRSWLTCHFETIESRVLVLSRNLHLQRTHCKRLPCITHAPFLWNLIRPPTSSLSVRTRARSVANPPAPIYNKMGLLAFSSPRSLPGFPSVHRRLPLARRTHITRRTSPLLLRMMMVMVVWMSVKALNHRTGHSQCQDIELPVIAVL